MKSTIIQFCTLCFLLLSFCSSKNNNISEAKPVLCNYSIIGDCNKKNSSGLFDDKKSTFIEMDNKLLDDAGIFVEFDSTQFVSKIVLRNYISRIYQKNYTTLIYLDGNITDKKLINNEIVINQNIKNIKLVFYNSELSDSLSSIQDSVFIKLGIVDNSKKLAFSDCVFYDKSVNRIKIEAHENSAKNGDEIENIDSNNSNLLNKYLENRILGGLFNKFIRNVYTYNNQIFNLIFKLSSNNKLIILAFNENNDLIKYYKGNWKIKNKFSNYLIMDLDFELIFNAKENSKTVKNIKTECTITDNYININSENLKFYTDFNNDALINLMSFRSSLKFEIRYATTNNFTSKQLYDKPVCYLRYLPALDLILANKELDSMGYCLKLFDGYRPLSVQRLMWEAFPNKNYVANPDFGSIHNRGGAIDVTICKLNGDSVNMGTDYDHFGIEAFQSYILFEPEVLENRRILREILEKHGFRPIKTEWWHYSHYSCMQYPVTDQYIYYE